MPVARALDWIRGSVFVVAVLVTLPLLWLGAVLYGSALGVADVFRRGRRPLALGALVVLVLAAGGAQAQAVPLPFVVCAYTRSGLVVRESFHAEYGQAAERARVVLHDGLEVTTAVPATATHFVPAAELREVAVWRWEDAGSAPTCPRPLPVRPPPPKGQ